MKNPTIKSNSAVSLCREGEDRSFAGGPLSLQSRRYAKGLGWAANTVIVHTFEGKYANFVATVGSDNAVCEEQNPKASAFLVIMVDGVAKFESEPMLASTAPKPLQVDLRRAQTLVLRLAGHGDDNGDLANDLALRADARLIGKAHP